MFQLEDKLNLKAFGRLLVHCETYSIGHAFLGKSGTGMGVSEIARLQFLRPQLNQFAAGRTASPAPGCAQRQARGMG